MRLLKYIVLLFSVLILVGCEPVKIEKIDKKKTEKEIKSDYDLGQAFNFINFEIKVNNIDSFLTIDKELSSDHGLDIIKVPVEIKNLSDEDSHLSMFYYKIYGSKNKEVSSKGSYYNDSLDYSPDLKPGESYTRYLYIPYDGDGNYVLEFNNFSSKIKIVLKVSK